MKCLSLFSGEKRQISNFSSAELAQRMVKDKKALVGGGIKNHLHIYLGINAGLEVNIPTSFSCMCPSGNIQPHVQL